MIDQKNRNAYKRAWRNQRNYEARMADALKAVRQARVSFDLWKKADQDARTNTST